MSSGTEFPTGTVTFLFTDIEGSTRLLKRLREGYGDVLDAHQRILRDAFAAHDGSEIDTQGDSFFVAFRRAKDAVAAAVAAQRGLAAHEWPDEGEVRVRMGIHTGEPAVGGQRYVGLGVHRAARISAAAHGGQVLVSQTTRELLRDDPLPDVSLRDLGEHQLKDLDEPERLYQLVAPGLAESFPRLKTAAPAPFEGREGELVEAAQETVAGLRRPWRRHRRLVVGGVLAVLVVAGTIAAVVAATGGGSASAADHVDANAVGVVDPRNNTIASEIRVGTAPSALATAAGALWVANTDGDSVSRIDTKTNEVRQTVDVGGAPSGVAVHAGVAWVVNGVDGTVSRIDAASNRVVQTFRVGNGPAGIAYGDGAIWVANAVDGTVARIDPTRGRVTRTIPAVVGASALAHGFGRLWVLSPSIGRIVAIDPRSGSVATNLAVGVDPSAVAVGSDAVWVANRGDGTVSRIDPKAGVVTDTIQVGAGPTALAVGSRAVWVANTDAGTLSRIDPASDRVVKTVALRNPPRGLAATPDGVYVAVRSTGRQHRGGTLRVASPFGVDSIDPAIAYSSGGWEVLTLTNDGLVGFRRVGGIQGIELVPDLAVSLPEATDGGRTYTFRLRPGVRYSNGAPVQPEDFRRALERVFEAGAAEPALGYYGVVVGAGSCRVGKRCDLSRGVVTDRAARTITFHLTRPDADFLTKLAMPWAFAVPVSTPGRPARRPLPATGPYLLTGPVKGGSVTLVRNPQFREWSADAQPGGFPDRIVLRVTAAPQVRIDAVKKNQVHVAESLDLGGGKQALDAVATQFPSQLRISTDLATHYFFLNTRVPPFDDLRVRRAVNYAFDRSAYLRLLGRAFAPACRILPPNYPAYRPGCPYGAAGAAGLERARRLIRGAGGPRVPVTVWMPDEAAPRGRFMAHTLRLLGYDAKVRLVPRGRYFPVISDPRTRAQIGFSGWLADFPSPAGFLTPVFACSAFTPAAPARNADPSDFCDPAVDRYLAHAATVQAQNPPAAAAAWQRAEDRILADAPIVTTANPRRVDFLSRRVGDYQFNPQWGPLLDQLWVK